MSHPNNSKRMFVNRIVSEATKQLSILLGLMFLTMAFGSNASAQSPGSQFFQGFEVNNDWNPTLVARVASGTNGITSKTGGFHAQAANGDFTRWGGYNATFPAHGYVTTVAIYLNVGGGFANDTRFDWDSSSSDSSGGFRRDFVFNAGYYNDSDMTGSGPRFVVSASTNAGRGSSFPKNPGRDPFAITTSGWYTFKHRFYNNSGVLAVELSIINSSNVTIHTWTLSDPSDTIPANIGGNRYGWFVNIEMPYLAIDDSERANVILTIPVDDDGMASATDCNASDPANSTIQGGIDASAAGDTVKVCPGTYTQAGSISLNKAIVLQGPNSAISPNGGVRVAEAIINGAVNPVLRISLPGNPVTIEGFKFDSTGVVDAYDPALNITIRKNIYSNGTSSGAFYFLNAPIQLTLDDNHLTNAVLPDEEAVFVAGNWNGTTGTVASITNNVIENTPTASSTAMNLSNVSGTISGNQFTNLKYYAILLANNSSSMTISNNVFDGIVNPSPGTVPSYGAGVRTYTPSFTGLVSITGNTFKNSYTGVGIRGVPNDAGADITGMNIHVNYNRFINNTYGISDGAAGTLDAENNWWGCNYGPGATGGGCGGTTNGVRLDGTAIVDSSPWLTLTTAAVPNGVTPGGMSTVTSKLTINSARVDTSGSGTVPNGIPASFVGTQGTVAPPSSTTTSGVTGTVFTAGATPGIGGVTTTIDGQTVNAPIGVYSTTCATVSIPTVQALNATVATIPVNTSEMTLRGALSADFTINYNSAVLTPVAGPTFGVAFGSVGTSNGGGRELTVTNPSPGILVISIFGSQEMQGSGPLVNLNFNVIGLPATSSPLTFGSPTFRYNEGSPCSSTTNGSLSVISGTISGTVSYGNAVGMPAPPRHVRNVTLSAAGSIPQSAVTGTNGTYSLSGMGAGAYTVTPSKSGGDLSAVSGLDASYIAQFVVGAAPGSMINATQQTVADVSGAGGISSFDAALIARYVALLPDSGSAGTWRFVPVSRSYPNVNANQTAQDYDALLMGDVTGSWNDPMATRIGYSMGLISMEKPVGVTAGNVTASSGSDFTVPITVTPTKGKGIVAYQFDLAYDATVLRSQPMPVDVVGAISSGMSITVNSDTPGLLKIVVFGALPINGEGVLLNLKFTAIGKTGATSVLTLRDLMLNEGMPFSISTDGQVQITPPTAKEAEVSGRLMTADGQAVANVIVKLTNAQGESHTTLSNELGDYRFGGVKVGQSYTVSVESGRFNFSPQTVSVEYDLANVNLFARP